MPDVTVRELLVGDIKLAQQFLQIYEQLYVDKDTERTRIGLAQGLGWLKEWIKIGLMKNVAVFIRLYEKS